jgi:hypothetical protein
MPRWSVFISGLDYSSIFTSPCRNFGRNEGKQVGRTSNILRLNRLIICLFPSRVLMAHAERLTAQVKTMSARIKELEATLANAQKASLPSGNEPVSQLEGSFQDSELTGDKYERDLDSVSKNLGSLAIDGEGKAQYYGVTAGAEVRPFSLDLSPGH